MAKQMALTLLLLPLKCVFLKRSHVHFNITYILYIARYFIRVREKFFLVKKMRSWLRASMKISTSSRVALIKIYYDIYFDNDRAVKVFLDLQPQVFNKDSLAYWIYHQYFALHIFHEWCNNLQQNIFNVLSLL